MKLSNRLKLEISLYIVSRVTLHVNRNTQSISIIFVLLINWFSVLGVKLKGPVLPRHCIPSILYCIWKAINVGLEKGLGRTWIQFPALTPGSSHHPGPPATRDPIPFSVLHKQLHPHECTHTQTEIHIHT